MSGVSKALRDGDLMLIVDRYHPADVSRDVVPAYFWRMHHAEQHQDMGIINLRLGNTPNITQIVGHIGYHVDPPWRGHHYAQRATKLLIPLAYSFGMSELIITANPDNIPSRRSIEGAGGSYINTVQIPPQHELYVRGEFHKVRYVIPTNSAINEQTTAV